MRHPVDLFLAVAQRQPHAPAVSIEGQEWTYQDLEQRARQFAAHFSQISSARVLIALPPSFDAYACILGSLLSGATHTPINTTSPEAKLRVIAEILEPNFIVASGQLATSLSEAAPRAIIVDPARVTDTERLAGIGARNEISYIMFTSGSTGVPKGVIVPAAGLANYVDWLSQLNCTAGDRVSQQPNLGFDISMTDIFGALCYGATLVPLVSQADRLTPAKFIRRERITVWNSTPSAVGLMLTARHLKHENLSTLRLINFCGEPLLKEILDAIFRELPHVLVQNTYGPTEATVAVTCLKLTSDNYDQFIRSSVAIGDAIAGNELHLVGGGHDNEGEIVITGAQLAQGYWRNTEKTTLAFRTLQINGENRAAYFTGDWAERVDGSIYFKERIDFQVKVKGHRVELDEVAAAIRASGWPVVSVFKRGEALAAVVEKVVGQPFSEKEIRLRLSQKLDAYAIPDRIIEVERVPRNDNEKVDRKASLALFEELMNGEIG